MVFITDDYCEISEEFNGQFLREKTRLNLKVFSVIIGAKAKQASTRLKLATALYRAMSLVKTSRNKSSTHSEPPRTAEYRQIRTVSPRTPTSRDNEYKFLRKQGSGRSHEWNLLANS